MTKYCCKNCFSIDEIRQFIEEPETVGKCDYCSSRRMNIRSVSDVGAFIMEGVERHYEDAAVQVGYCSSEGGYQLPTMDLSEILIEDEAIFGDAIDDPSQLLEDLVSLDGTPYVRVFIGTLFHC
jgi:hypothetical protein